LALEKTNWKSERDTLFQILRKGVEVMIGYYNNTEDIQLKDECRKTLVKVLKREKFKVIIDNLSRSDRDSMDKLNVNYVKDRAESNKEHSRYLGIDSIDDLDLNEIKPQVEKEAVLKLKFGKLKEKDSPLSQIGNGLLSTEQTDQDPLSEYKLYLENGNMEFFQVYKDKVFGFINKLTFEDSFKLDADWKVRFYALEEIYIQLCGLPQLKNDQLWNLNKFVYVQLNCGIRIDFLDKEKHQRSMKMSLKDFRSGFEAVGCMI
jgi:hypothetical protein